MSIPISWENDCQTLFTCCRYILNCHCFYYCPLLQFPIFLRKRWTPCCDMSSFWLIAFWESRCLCKNTVSCLPNCVIIMHFMLQAASDKVPKDNIHQVWIVSAWKSSGTRNGLKMNKSVQCPKKNFKRPLKKLTRKSGLFEAKYKEIRSGPRLLHIVL